MNQLTAKLGVARPESRAEAGNSDGWAAGDDAPGRCPVEEVQVSATTRAILDQRVQAMTSAAPVVPPVAPAVAAPVTAPARLPTPAPAMPLIATDAGVQDVQESLRAWVASWSAKDTQRYIGFYAKDYKPGTMSHAAWVAQRTRRVGKAGTIKVELADVKVRQIDANQVEAAFTQIYTSDGFADRVAKVQTWKRIDGRWAIVDESTK